MHERSRVKTLLISGIKQYVQRKTPVLAECTMKAEITEIVSTTLTMKSTLCEGKHFFCDEILALKERTRSDLNSLFFSS